MMTETPSPGADLPALTAIVYSDGPAAGRLLVRIAQALVAAGYACAGFVQHDEMREGRSR